VAFVWGFFFLLFPFFTHACGWVGVGSSALLG
jgi:hypothetical protein